MVSFYLEMAETAQQSFAQFAAAKEQAASQASLAGFSTTVEDGAGSDLLAIGSSWTRTLFDGDFFRSAGGRTPDLPVVTLVRDSTPPARGATKTDRPVEDATTVHLIHEGLTRVDADAVLSGLAPCSTGTDWNDLVASVWHPELVALRLSRGLPRHPVQVVVSDTGELEVGRCVLFDEPTLRVMVVTATRHVAPLSEQLQARPWVRVLDAGEPLSLARALVKLRDEGLAVISALGGRRVASTLLAEGLVTDLYLTSSDDAQAEPSRDIHDGPPVLQRRVLGKQGRRADARARFVHLVASTSWRPGEDRVGR